MSAWKPGRAGGTPLGDWLDAAWAQTAEVRCVTVEGATVRYRGWGMNAPAERGILFVHGFLAHARWWDHIAPHFADGRRVTAIDLTGMGDSDRRPEYSRKQYGHEILGVIEDAGLGPCTIIAHSFGSLSSLYAAFLRPDLIERIVIIDAHVFRAEDERKITPPPEKFYPTREDALARYRLTPPGEWPVPEIFDYLAANSIRETEQGWGWKFDPQIFHSAHKEKIRDGLKGMAIPVDFIRAAHSEIVGAEEQAAFVDAMPGCGPPIEIPLTHHHIMIEQPALLVTALRALLANPRGRATISSNV